MGFARIFTFYWIFVCNKDIFKGLIFIFEEIGPQMKVFKYIFILFLLVAIALCVFVATNSSSIRYSKSITIATTDSVAINLIKNGKEWQFWNTNATEFKDFKFNESTKESTWLESDAEYTLKNAIATSKDSISQEITFEGSVFKLNWKTEKDATAKNEVKVTLTASKKMNFKEKFNHLFSNGSQKSIEDFVNTKLTLLQNYITNDLEAYEFNYNGVVKMQAENFIQYKDTCNASEFEERIGKIKVKLDAFIKEFGIISVGKPFIMYQPVLPTGESIAFAYCLPVEEEILSSPGSEIGGGYHDEFMAFKTTLFGNPNRRFESWEKTTDSLVNTLLVQEPNSFYIETIEKDSKSIMKRKTEFYIPLVTPKKEVVKPVTANGKKVTDSLK